MRPPVAPRSFSWPASRGWGRPGCWPSSRAGRATRASGCCTATASSSARASCPYAPLVGVLRPLARDDDPVLADARRPRCGRSSRACCPRSATRTPRRRRPSRAPARAACSRRCSTSWCRSASRPRCCWPSRTSTGPIARPARSSSFLARALVSERVLIVATYRPDELHRRHALRPLLADLERGARVRRVELAPLSKEELAEALAGHPRRRARRRAGRPPPGPQRGQPAVHARSCWPAGSTAAARSPARCATR